MRSEAGLPNSTRKSRRPERPRRLPGRLILRRRAASPPHAPIDGRSPDSPSRPELPRACAPRRRPRLPAPPGGGRRPPRCPPPYLFAPPPLESLTTVLRARSAAKSASRLRDRVTAMAAMEDGRRRDDGDENVNNQLATGALDGATATQRRRRWTARPATAMEQCVEWTGNVGATRDARWRRRDKR